MPDSADHLNQTPQLYDCPISKERDFNVGREFLSRIIVEAIAVLDTPENLDWANSLRSYTMQEIDQLFGEIGKLDLVSQVVTNMLKAKTTNLTPEIAIELIKAIYYKVLVKETIRVFCI